MYVEWLLDTAIFLTGGVIGYFVRMYQKALFQIVFKA